MAGERDLDRLLGSLSAALRDGVYVFATVPHGAVPPDLDPVMVFREREGTTLILPRETADRHDIPCEFPCRMITLTVHSSLEAVGFIARIATELARAGMGVNPVSGFYHDHLFVPDGREAEALEILARLAADHAQG